MEPVTSINKAYSIIQIVEKQKRVQVEIAEAENTALCIRGENMRPERSGARPQSKKTNVDKRSLHCTYCQGPGHSQNTCFKLHATPDWYKELADRRKKDGGSNRAFLP
ncbi:UNVERIFIED_CONTAM: hypothetical protein Sindi_1351900 [Sesamum indicum]